MPVAQNPNGLSCKWRLAEIVQLLAPAPVRARPPAGSRTGHRACCRDCVEIQNVITRSRAWFARYPGDPFGGKRNWVARIKRAMTDRDMISSKNKNA
jgi:hypothetical protein